MNHSSHTESNLVRIKEVSNDAIVLAEDLTEEAIDATKDKLHRAGESVKEMYHSATVKADETLQASKEYVRRNPVPVVLGAIALGAAFGYVLQQALRKQTFSERYADEPMSAMREALLSALSPVTHRVHDGYDMVRDSAGSAMKRMHHMGKGHMGNSFSDRVCRMGNNLKFW